MKADTSTWKTFYLHRLFNAGMGNKFDMIAMTSADPSVNFVTRTSDDNGIGGEVDPVEGVAPYPVGCLTLALGGSLGSCFLQTAPFYTAQNVAVLQEKEPLSMECKLFIATIIQHECKLRFQAFGRELNAHYKTDLCIRLPALGNNQRGYVIDATHKYSDQGYIPDWLRMEDYMGSLHHLPVSTRVASSSPCLDTNTWGTFRIGGLFSLENGKSKNASELEDGEGTVYVGAKKNDNGIIKHVAANPDLMSRGNCIVFICNGQGSVGYANYMDQDFIGTMDIVTGHSQHLNKYSGLFIATVYCLERRRYSFGRKMKTTLADNTIKLPQTLAGEPDWTWMEGYMKSLPYSDRI